MKHYRAVTVGRIVLLAVSVVIIGMLLRPSGAGAQAPDVQCLVQIDSHYDPTSAENSGTLPQPTPEAALARHRLDVLQEQSRLNQRSEGILALGQNELPAQRTPALEDELAEVAFELAANEVRLTGLQQAVFRADLTSDSDRAVFSSPAAPARFVVHRLPRVGWIVLEEAVEVSPEFCG